MAGLHLLCVLGRSDKTKKVIIQEHACFINELSRLYLTTGADVNMRILAAKVIANFGVDFKSYLSIPGLADQLIADIQQPADSQPLATLKKCAAFALKNLSFNCGSKYQCIFDSVLPLPACLGLLDACMLECSSLRGHLLEQILLVLRQQLNPVATIRLNDEELPEVQSSVREAAKTDKNLITRLKKIYIS